MPYRGRGGNDNDTEAGINLYSAQQRLQTAIENWDGTAAPLLNANLTPEVAFWAEALCHQWADSLDERLKTARPEDFGKIITQWQRHHGTSRLEAAFWHILGKEIEHDGPP